LLRQLVVSWQFALLLHVAVSKVLSCHSPHLWVQSYIASSCRSLKDNKRSEQYLLNRFSYWPSDYVL
jgi:hypothetical protein